MKRFLASAIAGALLFAAAATASAQQPSQEDLKKRLDDKLAEPWVKDGGWNTDYDAARAEAKKGGKLLFTYFTRSYSP